MECRGGGTCLSPGRDSHEGWVVGSAVEGGRGGVDGHRCEGRSLEARVCNWGAWRDPGEEVKELVKVAKKVTACLCSPLTKMRRLRQQQESGMWSPGEAANAFTALSICCGQLLATWRSQWVLDVLPSRVDPRKARNARRHTLVFSSSDRCGLCPCDPLQTPLLPRHLWRVGRLLHTVSQARHREETAPGRGFGGGGGAGDGDTQA